MSRHLFRRAKIGSGVALLLLLVGCDPGLSYRPEGWQESGKFKWATTWENVEISTRSLAGLAGSESMSPEFTFTNRTPMPVVLESAVLLAGDASYPGQLPGSGDLRWRTAAPGATQRIAVLWHFDKSVQEVLGPSPKLVLSLSHGGRPQPLEIRYARSE